MSLSLAATVQTSLAPVAFAAVAPPSACNWGEVWYGIDTQQKPWAVTHATWISVAPKTTFNQSVTLTKTRTFTGSVTGSIESTAEGNTIIAKAGVKVALTLQAMYASTNQDSVATSWTYYNGGTTQKRFAIGTVTHNVTGSWTKWACQRTSTYKSVANGTYGSWDVEGNVSADCSVSYPSGSPEQAIKAYCPK